MSIMLYLTSTMKTQPPPSIWPAHTLGSGIDSKNNKNPYTVISVSLHVKIKQSPMQTQAVNI
jgi:hypothetical protein